MTWRIKDVEMGAGAIPPFFRQRTRTCVSDLERISCRLPAFVQRVWDQKCHGTSPVWRFPLQLWELSMKADLPENPSIFLGEPSLLICERPWNGPPSIGLWFNPLADQGQPPKSRRDIPGAHSETSESVRDKLDQIDQIKIRSVEPLNQPESLSFSWLFATLGVACAVGKRQHLDRGGETCGQFLGGCSCHQSMNVAWYGGFLKWGYPKMDGL